MKLDNKEIKVNIVTFIPKTMLNDTDSECKVVVIGDSVVGKTSLLTQYNMKQFNPTTDTTIGASFICATEETSKGPVTLHIWDTAGQEKYRSLIPMYSRYAVAAIVVVDVTMMSSYEHVQDWISVVRCGYSPKCQIYIVANKIDLEPKVPLGALAKFANENGYSFFKTSALDYSTVAPVFHQIAEDIAVKRRKNEVEQENIIQPITENETQKSNCC